MYTEAISATASQQLTTVAVLKSKVSTPLLIKKQSYLCLLL
jgi:hypothetical protein